MSLVGGVDLGGTHMQFGVVDGAGRVVARARARTDSAAGAAAVIARMAEGVREACGAAGVRIADLAAVGVGAPAPVDTARGVVTFAPNLGWRNVALADELRTSLGPGAPPIFVDNDVNAAAYGEYRAGAGRGADDLIALWIGTGVGGGIVLGGRVQRGAFFTGGEVGQMILLPEAPEGRRSVESRCARTAIARRLAGVTGEPAGLLTAQEIARRFSAGDPAAVAAVGEALDLLGVAAANLVTVLGAARVVVGGGLAEVMGESLVGRVREATRANVFYEQCRGVEVALTQLGDNAGVVGAALLAAEAANERPPARRL